MVKMKNFIVAIIILHFGGTNIIFADFSAKSQRVAVRLAIRMVTQFVQKNIFLTQIYFCVPEIFKTIV